MKEVQKNMDRAQMTTEDTHRRFRNRSSQTRYVKSYGKDGWTGGRTETDD